MMIVRTIGKYDLVYSPEDGGYYWHDTDDETVTTVMSREEAKKPLDDIMVR